MKHIYIRISNLDTYEIFLLHYSSLANFKSENKDKTASMLAKGANPGFIL